MYDEDDLLPISALQHVMYCERQFALIHVEQLWADNRFTAEGEILHERVDREGHESRRLFRQEFAMSLRSLVHGLIGKTDLVELYLDPDGLVVEAIPVEFKRGKAKEGSCDRVQLYAQALCLEEMFGIGVTHGDFYYLSEHRRTHVEFDAGVRDETASAMEAARKILGSRRTPTTEYSPKKCDRCSLLDLCMPRSAAGGGQRIGIFVAGNIAAMRKECDT